MGTHESLFDTVNLYIAAASIVLAVIALVLSIVFYRWGDKTAKEADRAFRNIEGTVSQLHSVTSLLYTEMFAMVKGISGEHSAMLRDAVQALQRRFSDAPTGTQAAIEQRINDQLTRGFNESKSQLTKDVVANLTKLPSVNTNDEVREQIASTMSKAFDDFRQIDVETRQKVLRKAIVQLVSDTHAPVTARDVIANLADSFPRNRIVQELERLADEKVLDVDPWPMTPISVVRRRA